MLSASTLTGCAPRTLAYGWTHAQMRMVALTVGEEVARCALQHSIWHQHGGLLLDAKGRRQHRALGHSGLRPRLLQQLDDGGCAVAGESVDDSDGSLLCNRSLRAGARELGVSGGHQCPPAPSFAVQAPATLRDGGPGMLGRTQAAGAGSLGGAAPRRLR